MGGQRLRSGICHSHHLCNCGFVILLMSHSLFALFSFGLSGFQFSILAHWRWCQLNHFFFFFSHFVFIACLALQLVVRDLVLNLLYISFAFFGLVLELTVQKTRFSPVQNNLGITFPQNRLQNHFSKHHIAIPEGSVHSAISHSSSLSFIPLL
jgi:hypothetical protein